MAFQLVETRCQVELAETSNRGDSIQAKPILNNQLGGFKELEPEFC
jgi:hypothetical protein